MAEADVEEVAIPPQTRRGANCAFVGVDQLELVMERPVLRNREKRQLHACVCALFVRLFHDEGFHARIFAHNEAEVVVFYDDLTGRVYIKRERVQFGRSDSGTERDGVAARFQC